MSKTALLAVLVAAGGGFGLGHVLGSTKHAPTESVLDVGLYVSDDAPAPDSTLLKGSDGPSLTAAPQPAVRAGMEAVLEALPMPTRLQGVGIITGTVMTAAGEPLAGVKISCTPMRDRPTAGGASSGVSFDALPLTERIERRVKRLVDSARWNEVNQTKSTTGSDGSFTLPNIADVTHRVTARLEGWKIGGNQRRGTARAKPGTNLKFLAQRITGIRLEVVGPDGKAPDRAQAQMKSSQGSSSRYWRPARTLVEFKRGHYELTLTAGEHGELRSEPMQIEVTAEAGPALRVELLLSPVVMLSVKFPEGEDMRGSVYVLKIEGPEAPTGATLKSRGKQVHRYGRTDAARKLNDLEEGWYAIGYSRGESFDVVETLQVKPGVVRHTLTVPPVPRDQYVVARVHGPDGEPVVGARIRSGFTSPTESYSGGQQFSDRSNGEYMVMLDPRGSASEDVTYWVDASSGAFGRARAEFRKVGGQTLDLQFAAPAQAHFTIDGAKASGLQTSISCLLTEKSHAQSHKCDAQGKVSIQPMQPGTYIVQIRVGEHYMTEVARETVTIRSGANNIALTLPTLYTVTIRGAERQVMVTSKRGTSKASRNPRPFMRPVRPVKGEAVVDGLPAGDYVVRGGRKNAEFTVPGTSIVTLEARK